MPAPRLLPAVSPVSRLSYVGSQILGDLGPSETTLSSRAVKRIHKSFPVPLEQEILWADVAFGTRCHGLVLTNAGIFFKDGPGDEDDDLEDQEPQDTGYHYLRWANFDPAVISHQNGHPTIGGQLFRDKDRFFNLAAACVRITNRRVRMQRAGRTITKGILDPQGPIHTLFYPSVKETFARCFDDEGFYAPVTSDDIPLRIEVAADQYDALLQRMAKKVEAGWAPPLEDGKAAGTLVRKSAYTYAQALNLARTGRITGVYVHPTTEAVICKNPKGLTASLQAWLEERDRRGAPVSTDGALSPEAAQALASGAASQKDASKITQANMANFLVDNAASTAGRTVGAAGARVLTAAMGITFAPLALAASFALGDMCGKAGAEAVTMAKDLFFEPEAHIYGRLLDGVLSNVVFEYALTTSEQAVLAALMTKVNPEVFQRLGAALRNASDQEELVRALVVPLCETVRKM